MCASVTFMLQFFLSVFPPAFYEKLTLLFQNYRNLTFPESIPKRVCYSFCVCPYQDRWYWNTPASGCPDPGSGAAGPLEGMISPGSWSPSHRWCCKDSKGPRSSRFYSPARLWGLRATLMRSLGSLEHHYRPKNRAGSLNMKLFIFFLPSLKTYLT